MVIRINDSPLSDTEEGDRSAVETPDEDSSEEKESARVLCGWGSELSERLRASRGVARNWASRLRR